MAPNGRANPSCPNGSNPYHECSPACSLKSKPRSSTKRTSGYRRSVTDGELSKKVNEKRRTYAACPKASNPYHQCDDNCHKRLSDSSGAPPPPPPLKLEIRKKKSETPPLVDASVPTSKVGGAIYLSDSSTSPISYSSQNEEVKSHSSEHLPSTEIQVIPDVKSQKDPIVKEDRVASSKVVPVTYVNVDNSEEGLTTTSSGRGAGNGDSMDDDPGETESVMSEYRTVQVDGYNVKESFAPILQSILDKHGDIGAGCHLESLVMRSYYIESVCFVVQELQSCSSSSKLNELLAIVKDVESAQLQVAWLQSMLDEIAKNIHQNQDAKELESLREELESQLQTLAQKEKEVADIKTRIPEIRDRLSKLEPKSSQLDNKSMLSIKSFLDNLLS